MTAKLARRPILAGLGALPFGSAASAQAVNRTARIIVGFPAGGTVDLVARLLAERLRPAYAPALIVENRTGAVGRLAIDATRAADPDGTTILISPASMLTIFPHLYPNLRYDPLVDLTAVSPVVGYVFGLAVGPAVPNTVRTLAELLDWVRGRGNEAPFASPAAGSAAHFLGLQLAAAAGVTLTHIPYRGAPPAIQDALGGQIPIVTTVIGDQVTHHLTGRLRILAVTSANRLPRLPDVPTFAESGFPEIVHEEWFGAFLPPRAAPPLVDELARLLGEIALIPEHQEALARLEMTATASDPASFHARIVAELQAWKPVVAASGFRADE